MPKSTNKEVLRLFNGPNVTEDWASINAYTKTDIDHIVDPAWHCMKEFTSIPSPFARIHLFEQAFQVVSSNVNTMDGRTLFHKLVSDALDVGEVLFNYDLFQKSNSLLQIITWNKQTEINQLLTSRFPSHRLLGNTLSLYLNQDGPKSNFDKMRNIHLISCNHCCIGGTSPSTLFFAACNDTYELSALRLIQGNHTFFDNDFAPLYRRSIDFQKYLHGLFEVNPVLKIQMPLFYQYLERSRECLQASQPVLYQQLHTYLDSPTLITDFPTQFKAINDGLDIFDNIWHLQNKHYLLPGPVPAPDYPEWTASDFLEPVLIQLRYRMNKEYFFEGNLVDFFQGDTVKRNPPDFSYLLPIKPLFFKYFEVSN
jgi:hypothetical protein